MTIAKISRVCYHIYITFEFAHLQKIDLLGRGMKVALVTGGSRGIGAATVEKFAKENYTVILNYRNSEKAAQQLRDRLLQEGCDVHLCCADVSDSAQVSQMFFWISKYFKKLDVLVNNAGVALTGLFQDVTEAQFDSVVNTNVKGTYLCAQRAVEMFLKQGQGSIVNVSSIWGLQGASCEAVYSLSKHAVVGLTRSLAKELEPSGIRVNCICPPIVETEMCRHLSRQDIVCFCKEHGVSAYSPNQVAEDIFRLATGSESGIIFEEK